MRQPWYVFASLLLLPLPLIGYMLDWWWLEKGSVLAILIGMNAGLFYLALRAYLLGHRKALRQIPNQKKMLGFFFERWIYDIGYINGMRKRRTLQGKLARTFNIRMSAEDIDLPKEPWIVWFTRLALCLFIFPMFWEYFTLGFIMLGADVVFITVAYLYVSPRAYKVGEENALRIRVRKRKRKILGYCFEKTAFKRGYLEAMKLRRTWQ